MAGFRHGVLGCGLGGKRRDICRVRLIDHGYELCLQSFRKIPFTCSYMPGRRTSTSRPSSMLCVEFERQALVRGREGASLAAILMVFAAAAGLLRWRTAWLGSPLDSLEETLEFDERSAPAVMVLGLNRVSTSPGLEHRMLTHGGSERSRDGYGAVLEHRMLRAWRLGTEPRRLRSGTRGLDHLKNSFQRSKPGWLGELLLHTPRRVESHLSCIQLHRMLSIAVLGAIPDRTCIIEHLKVAIGVVDRSVHHARTARGIEIEFAPSPEHRGVARTSGRTERLTEYSPSHEGNLHAPLRSWWNRNTSRRFDRCNHYRTGAHACPSRQEISHVQLLILNGFTHAGSIQRWW